MRIGNALVLIETHNKNNATGFMVSFELRERGMLASDHFPDAHNGEPLIQTEEEAWRLASEFSKVSTRYVNIYVINQDYRPVAGYRERILNRYQKRSLDKEE